MTLTEAGQALLPEARATLAAAQAAADAVAEATAGLRGTLFVGTMISTGPVDVSALLARFHEQHPGVPSGCGRCPADPPTWRARWPAAAWTSRCCHCQATRLPGWRCGSWHTSRWR